MPRVRKELRGETDSHLDMMESEYLKLKVLSSRKYLRVFMQELYIILPLVCGISLSVTL